MGQPVTGVGALPKAWLTARQCEIPTLVPLPSSRLLRSALP
ncbi:hypothetical protein JOF56_009230 [Kibdelosporangium banguiense]|uniref:Uncharacterized protein n=1 Tax=Kibdelosporangium banguiense TaxID=1365924 RepID=A0ABS4TWR3_9PSEU|nr:hypothetical protein [Kibdelosporangium banguiense]MBP2328845.1 hypothetical protein [Kibdelosporangium banguiense]